MEFWAVAEALLRIVPAIVSAAREMLPGGVVLAELDSVRRVEARITELEQQRAANPPDLALLGANDEDVLLAIHGSMEVMSVLLAAVIERRTFERPLADGAGEAGAPSPPLPRRRAARLPRGPGGPRSGE